MIHNAFCYQDVPLQELKSLIGTCFVQNKSVPLFTPIVGRAARSVAGAEQIEARLLSAGDLLSQEKAVGVIGGWSRCPRLGSGV